MAHPLLALLSLLPLAPGFPAGVGDGPCNEGAPPNVLVLVLDDIGTEFLGAYGIGPDLAVTPNIDRLAIEGTLFTDCWAMPLCSPTRAALQTGRFGFRTGVGGLVTNGGHALPLSEITLPEMLDAGTGGLYEHAVIGKWHLGNPSVGGDLAPNLAGYGHFVGTVHNFVLPDTFFSWAKITNGVKEPCAGYATTVVVDETLAWIGNTTGPWFATVNFHAPHWPWHVPPANLYSTSLTHAPPVSVNPRPYAKAMLEAVDAEIGRLRQSLGPVFDDALVIVVGDNGTDNLVVTAPYSAAKAKGSVFEGGIRVPLIVRGPGVATGVSAGLVSVVDIFPTVADAAGVDLDTCMGGATLDGISLWPYLQNPSEPSLRKYLFTELTWPNGVNPPQSSERTVREKRYKYIKSSTIGEHLYDLQLDPLENQNLLDGPLNPEQKRALRRLRNALTDVLAS